MLGELGRGGMGVVYLARNISLNRPCAIKTFSAGGSSPTAAARLRAEAETIARLRHPNVVQIYGVGDLGGVPFLELEYLPGGSLADAHAGTPRPVAEAARLMALVAQAVAAAHGLGIVHRDLKPSNVLLTADGEPKVGDFGLALSLASDTRLTDTGQLVGTPCYMAPEQAEAGAAVVGPAADVYSLGAILYELLTDHPPFRAATSLQTLHLVRSREPVAPRRVQPAVPRDLETICLKCLDKNPERRYLGAAALADDLGRFLDGRPVLARPTRTAERVWKWARRRPGVAVLSAALMITAALAFALVWWQWRRAEGKAAAEALAHAEARQARREALRGQAELAMDHGRALGEQGEIGRALLWLTQSLQLAADAGDAALERAARVNLTEWLAPLGRSLGRLNAPAPARGLAFLEGGRTLAALGDDGTLRLWDIGTGREAAPTDSAAARDRWNLARRLLGPVLPVGAPLPKLAFLGGGRRSLSATRDGQVRAWDLASLRVWPLPPESTALTSLAVAAGGVRFATGTEGGTVRLWDSTTLRQSGPTFKLDVAVRSLALRPDGQVLAVGLEDGTIAIREVPRAGPIAPPLSVQGPVRTVAFCREGRYLLAVADGGLQRWRLGPPGEPVHPVSSAPPHDADATCGGPAGPAGVTAVSPDGRLIATAAAAASSRGGRAASRVVLLDARTGAVVEEGLPEPHPVAGLAFSPDSRRLLTWGRGTEGALLRPVDPLGPGRPLFRSLGVAIHHAAFSPDGTTVLLGCRDAKARLWDLARDVEVHSPLRPRHAYPITAVAFDPRSARVATGCHAGTVRLWDRTSGALLHDLRGNAGEITAFAFSPDGATLVTASLDATARFWDVASGRQLGPPRHHEGPVLSVAFHPDGRLVATGTRDGSAWLWPVPAAPMEGDVARIAGVVEERTGLSSDGR
jgi:WD40 repeat protein